MAAGRDKDQIKAGENDQKAFEGLFKEDADHIRGSNLTAYYNYFYERIQKQEVTIEDLFEAIYRLEIIDIVLDGEDNPQLIFESLNSTGMDLSEGDKIRNYILMGLTSRLQEKYYDEYWNPIELYTGYDVSSFVRDYLSVKRQSIPSQKRIYVSFKEYVELTDQKAEVILRDMKEYARRYRTLLHGETGHKALDACIYRLNRLETTVTRPFFLEVLRLYDEKIINMDQVTEIFLTTENFLFRRSICNLPTNVLNKIFVALHKEILRFDGTEQNYVEKFKYVLLSKKERSRFPVDGEFSQNFAERQIYLMNSKNKIYILERLENCGTKEDKDVYRHWDDGTYSIEHIMPQHLTPKWQEELGENYEAIHETWIHRVANLTLTAYNSEYSNLPFEEKKTLDKKGFNDSGIRLNAWIAGKEHWTLQELEERSRHLTKRAFEIWPIVSTGYRPAVKEEDSCTLADDEDLTGRQIERFSYRNAEQPVFSWAEMFQKMIQILYAEDKTLISGLAASDDEGLASHFAYEPQNLKKFNEIGDGIYVWTNMNTSGKLSILSHLFKLYDLDPSDLTFYLRDADEDEEEDAQIGRYKLRKRYWTYALPIIKAANVENEPFSNVNPGKDNAIHGYFGVRGFSIACIANYDLARVELVLAKDNTEANKKAFDALATHREEAEQKLETELIWDRGDDITSSKIYLRLLNVSIENETDWKQMAAFHAKWTRKFYDWYSDDMNKLPRHVFNALRSGLQNGMELLVPIETPKAFLDMIGDPEKVKKGDQFTLQEDVAVKLVHLNAREEGKHVIPAFTSERERNSWRPGASCVMTLQSLIDQLDVWTNCLGYVINPGKRQLMLSRENLANILAYEPKSTINIVRGSVVDMHVDAIVNAANESLLGGGGVDGAIHAAAGPGLLEECRKLNGCCTGDAKITLAYDITYADHIIHTVGPVYRGRPEDIGLLSSCYWNSLDLALEDGCRSIAFPGISTGIYGYPLEEASIIALGTTAKWLKDHKDTVMNVFFCCFKEKEFDAFQEQLVRDQKRQLVEI